MYARLPSVEIATSPHLRGLRALNLELNRLGVDAARAFLDEAAFPHMVYLTTHSKTAGFQPS